MDDPVLDRLCRYEASGSSKSRTSYSKSQHSPILEHRLAVIQEDIDHLQLDKVTAIWRHRRDLSRWYVLGCPDYRRDCTYTVCDSSVVCHRVYNRILSAQVMQVSVWRVLSQPKGTNPNAPFGAVSIRLAAAPWILELRPRWLIGRTDARDQGPKATSPLSSRSPCQSGQTDISSASSSWLVPCRQVLHTYAKTCSEENVPSRSKRAAFLIGSSACHLCSPVMSSPDRAQSPGSWGGKMAFILPEAPWKGEVGADLCG